MKIDQQYVLVTGAARGIGRAIAVAYAVQGAKVILADKDAVELQKTAKALLGRGLNVSFYEVELSKAEAIHTLFQQLENAVPRLDVLINNAGLGAWKPPYDLEVDEWDYIINTNLRGTFLCSREAAKRMRNSGGGSIVNISSTRALMSEPDSEAYAASKGGILSLTHALAASLAPDRIRVNAISPGWIETGDYGQLKVSDHAQHFAGRVGKPEDIARACLYLTNPENDFVTGINLVVDGGMTRKMIYEE
ncbi:SDR family NAD(P)-dependent oxidoreductase [Paenibacillus hexagrammi]|uniref:SDR family oxidoreductase n=1 Tax=Paenibacillus hexagrammi TaxID=2908839 RepID=A0ABY3SE61_9BACL|nr:SDR family oxidoreductase [Paenibacillus sp. YPD9-1]UJF31693.1 SDR family oxidoreductase [Paenibacillus sp. YPD9-1]